MVKKNKPNKNPFMEKSDEKYDRMSFSNSEQKTARTGH